MTIHFSKTTYRGIVADLLLEIFRIYVSQHITVSQALNIHM